MMDIKEHIVVTDWANKNKYKGNTLKLTLNSDQRKIVRGKRLSDCNQEIHLQLPREGKLNDGDILQTNHKNLFVEIIAKKENLIKISASYKVELIKAAYHLGNRHVEVEIYEDVLLTKSDYVIEELLKNLEVDFSKSVRKFSPESGAFNHD